MIYQLIQILYWLFLSIWVGSTVYVAYAVPVVFRVVRRREVRLPDVTAEALRDEHETLLAGDIVAGLLGRLGQIQIICICAMLPLLAVGTLFVQDWLDGLTLAAKAALYLTASWLIFSDWRKRLPITLNARQRYIDHADEPAIAEQAKAEYERLHRAGSRVYQAVVFLLLGLLLVSANPSPRTSWVSTHDVQPVTPPAAQTPAK